MKARLQDILIQPHATILDAVRAIDLGAVGIALVADEDRRLLATVTDGDIRRGLLRGLPLAACVTEVMRRDPTAVRQEEGQEAALRLMRRLTIHQVPIVDGEGRVVGIEWADRLVGIEAQDTPVVLMAGGLGVRLRPLTDQIPKPMLPVGGRPLLETIIRNFADQGFRRFYISVNHRREIVQNFFGDGSRHGVEIEYLIEDQPLGTAGALSLLPERPTTPILVMNGDLLTAERFETMLRFHAVNRAAATMAAREYSHQVPYGVIRTKGPQLLSIEEKPTESYFVNAGIYVISPGALDFLALGQRQDMPELFAQLISGGHKACVFALQEYWLDIGRTDDLERARAEYEAVFSR